jgi:hypothetical protein
MALGDNCASACLTKDHESFGACVRSSNVRIGYCRSAAGLDATTEKKWQTELSEYRSARAQGVQPSGTSITATRRAMELSERTGQAWQADRSSL